MTQPTRRDTFVLFGKSIKFQAAVLFLICFVLRVGGGCKKVAGVRGQSRVALRPSPYLVCAVNLLCWVQRLFLCKSCLSLGTCNPSKAGLCSYLTFSASKSFSATETRQADPWPHSKSCHDPEWLYFWKRKAFDSSVHPARALPYSL